MSSAGNSDTESEINNITSADSSLTRDSLATSNPSSRCLSRFAAAAAAGALLGSIFGYEKKGFKGSFAEAGSSAKICNSIWSTRSSCLLFKEIAPEKMMVTPLTVERYELAMKMHFLLIYRDLLSIVINAGVAGCCTALALSFPGAPQALLQSCLTFGAFSFVIEGLNKQQPALAQPFSMGFNRQHNGVLPLLALPLPLPNEPKESFASFYQSIRK
ncbi:hypothetical protein OROHE_022330 [Orobanche hederae]